MDSNFGFYECDICGHQMQVLKDIEVEREIFNPETGQMEAVWVPEKDFDAEASFQEVLEHEKTHAAK